MRSDQSRSWLGPVTIALGLLLALAACTQPAPALTDAAATAGPGAAGAATDDPFAYCAAVVNIDAPDGRFAGPSLPPGVVNGLQTALGLPGTPAPPVAQNSTWRCMNGRVYACTFGANLPCLEKADTNRTPSQAVAEFCAANAESDVVPMAVSGRATVYEWRCRQGQPEIVSQYATVDPQGYLAEIWYEIQPAQP